MGATDSNDGKALEQLVRKIEERISPAGWAVTSRLKPRDEHGMQLAEFDIIVQGPAGSSSVKWLIECRDRKRPAPSSWIEQLYGRKVRFNFDRVFAVSTSGFTKSAKDACETLGVRMRRIHNISEISEDYAVHYAVPQIASMGEASILLANAWRYRRPQTGEMAEIDTESIELRMSEDDAFEPLTAHAYRYAMAYPDIINVEEKLFEWEISGVVDLLTSSGTVIKAKSLRGEFLFKQKVAQVPLVTSRLYEENGQIKAYETSMEVELEGSKFVITCYLTYDQAHDGWKVEAERPEGSLKWFPPSKATYLPGSALKTTLDT